MVKCVILTYLIERLDDLMLSGGIAPIYGVVVNDRTWITKNILDSPTVNYGTVLYVNQGPFSPD